MTLRVENGRLDTVPHEPVLLSSAVEFLQCRPGGLYVDATIGMGGHAEAILNASAPDGQLIAVDRDDEALRLCRERLAVFSDRVRFCHDNYKNLPLILNHIGASQVDGLLLDLGLSSFQLDTPERGFSFQTDGPLDMRMDRRQKLTAADLVNSLDEAALSRLIFEYGEEPAARRIARSIVRRRHMQPFRRTSELAAVVRRAAFRPGQGPQRRHEATRTFQALRIVVNDELDRLDELMGELAGYLKTGARMVVISFHSLEDRLIKTAFKRLAGCCTCDYPAPQCLCPRREEVRLLTRRPLAPSEEEVNRNPRARSARLRCIEKL